MTHNIKMPVYNDLDNLAGTWSQEDETEFNKAIADFEKVDDLMIDSSLMQFIP
jgi:hypothetical protein